MNQRQSIKNDADPNAITIDEARIRIFESLSHLNERETIMCYQALGRIVASDVMTQSQVPAFRASAMDGYAVRTIECSQPLIVSGQSLAGHPGDDHLPAFGAQRITTGARVPDDADAVVQQENVTRNNDSLVINVLPSAGLHIREPGSDTPAGITLLKTGDLIGASELALLASQGITRICVKRKLRVALFSTGDELVEPGTPVQPGQINDANRALLRAMLDEPMIELGDYGIAADSPAAIQKILDAASTADLVISSGGVSVGDADHIKDVLEKNGTLSMWKIAMKPGRPLTFGFLGENQAFFGLPGNPVSAALTCLLFVKPAIDYVAGHSSKALPAMHLPLDGDVHKNPGRVEYQRARVTLSDTGEWRVTTTGVQDSHVLLSLYKANCLIELPTDSTGATDGELVKVYLFTHFSRDAL